MKLEKKIYFLVILSLIAIIAGCGNDDKLEKSEEEGRIIKEEKQQDESSKEEGPKILDLTLEQKDTAEIYVETTAKGNDIQYAFYVMTDDDEIIEKFML